MPNASPSLLPQLRLLDRAAGFVVRCHLIRRSAPAGYAAAFVPLVVFTLPVSSVRLWEAPQLVTFWLMRWLRCRQLAAPPHAFCEGAAERVALGLARRADGTLAPVGPGLRDLRQVLHLTAGMGAGKSRLLANICRQLLPHGFILLDGKGDDRGGNLATTLRQYVSLADERRLVILDLLDTESPIGINPLAGTDRIQAGGIDLALGQVLGLLARLDPDTWSHAPGMQQYATQATLLVLAGEAQPTLAHVKQALLDASYCEGLLDRCGDPDVVSFWRVAFAQVGEGHRASRDELLRRFDNLLATETTRYLVTQALPRLDLARAIAEGLVVLVPLPHVALGGIAEAIGMLLFQAVVRAAFLLVAGGGTSGPLFSSWVRARGCSGVQGDRRSITHVALWCR